MLLAEPLPHALQANLSPDVVSSTDDYARRFSGAVGAWLLEVQTKALLSVIEPNAGALRVLDVGGGHAQTAPPLIEAGHDLVVYGSSPQCSQRMQPWIRAALCSFDSGPLTALPYQAGSFDVSVCFRIVPHLDAWKELIGELCRVTRRRVVIDYPARCSVNVAAGALFPLKREIEPDTRPFRTFTRREMSEAFGAHGFRVVEQKPQFTLPMALHRKLGSTEFSRALENFAQSVGITRAVGSPVVLAAERIEQR